jgi:hypothetical protein
MREPAIRMARCASMRAMTYSRGRGGGQVEAVRSVDIGVKWDPNCPEAQLLVDDDGNAVLTVNPHFDDPDTRRIVLSWSECLHAQHGAPNDEALHLHPLGLELVSVIWVGEVVGSSLAARLGRMTAAGAAGLRHYVLPMKESMVEVVARDEPAVSRQHAPSCPTPDVVL